MEKMKKVYLALPVLFFLLLLSVIYAMNASVIVTDIIPPTYSNINEPTDPSTYSPSGTYNFNITWNDNINVSKVILQFNGANYTDVIKQGNVYYKTFSGLAANIYQYKWFANDTSNNWNSTSLLSFTVSKATPSLNVASSAGWSITYPTSTQLSGSETNSGDADLTYILWMNNNQITNPTTQILGVGTYTVKYNTTGGQNYTSGSAQNTLTISKGSRIADVTFDKTSPITYETLLTVNCSVDKGANDGTWKLYRNSIDVTTSEKGIATRYGANTYNFNCSITGGANWTDVSKQESFTVNAKNANVQVFPTTQTQTYPYTATQYCIDDSSLLNCNIYRNNSLITNSSQYSPSAGVYVYKANISDTVNYTNYQDIETLTVNKATPVFSTSVTTPITYGTASSYSGSESNSGDYDCTYILLRNGTQIANGSSVSDSTVLGAGNYNYTYYTSGCTNYTFGKDEKNLVVNKAIPSGSLTSDKGWNIYTGTTVTVSYSESNNGDGGVVYKVWRDGADKGSGETWTPGTGNYNYKLNTTEGANYSAADNIDTETLVVSNKIPSSCSLTSSASWNINYPTSTTLSCSCTGDGTTHLYFNNTLHDNYNSTSMTFAAKPSGYYVVCNITEGVIYQQSSNSSTLIINKASQSVSVSPLTTVTYGTAVQTGCQRISGDSSSTLTLYRNGTQVAQGTTSPQNESSIILSAGTYNYTCTISENQNYSAASSVNNYRTINKATPTGSQSANPSWSVTYPAQTNVSCSLTTGDSGTTLTLKRDTVTVATGISPSEKITLGYKSGGYSYTCEYPATQNYSAVTLDTDTLTVSKASRTCTLATDKGWSRTYNGTASSTTCNVSAGSSDGTITFTKNSNPVSTPDSQTNAGTFNYACQWNGGINYSDCTQQINTLTINKASSSCSLTVSNHTYGTSDTVSCSCIGDGVTHLYRNGILHDEWNNIPVIFGVGTYNWICNITSGSNYNPASTSKTQTISKATPVANINILPAETVFYPTQTNTTCSISSLNNEVIPLLFRNNSAVSNPNVAILTAGNYVYVCNNSATQNYTTTQTQKTLVVNVGNVTPPIITILSPLNKTYYSNSTALTFTINEPTSWIGYSLDNRPNVTITGNIIITNLNDGSHNVVVYANDTSGNMGSSQKIYFTNNHLVYLPWETSYITSESYPVVDIEEYNNKLYWAANDKLYVFDGNSWNLIQAPINTLSLQNFSNKLYVAGNGGKIYSYDGNWTEVFNTNSQYAKMLGVYSNKLYAATFLAMPAKLYYSSNGINWYEDTTFSSTLVCPAPFCSIDSMIVNNSKMYVGSGGKVYQYNGASWIIINDYSDVYAYQDMKVYNNKLYFATRDQSARCPMYAGGSGFCGRVIEYNGTNWNTRFDYSYPTNNNGYWMYSLEVYNGRLYAGTANKIYMTSDGTNWQLTFNSLEGAQYALVLKTWNNKIYVGFGNGIMFKDDMIPPTTTTTTTRTTTSTTTTKTTASSTSTRPSTSTTRATTTTIKTTCYSLGGRCLSFSLCARNGGECADQYNCLSTQCCCFF